MNNILAIGAHPDDIEFGCFGTLKKHIDSGDTVILLVMSHSSVIDAYTKQPTRNQAISISEAKAAADIIGAELILAPFQDTNIMFDSDTVSYIERIVKQYNINTVYTHWPGDTHQDHINTLNATLAACRLVPNVLCYEQVPLPRVCVNYPVANLFIDITSTIDYKINASNMHKSQIEKYANQGIDLIDNLKTLARFRGIQINCKYAEAFNILKKEMKL